MLLRSRRFAQSWQAWMATGLVLGLAGQLLVRFGPRVWPSATGFLEGLSSALFFGVIFFLLRGIRLRSLSLGRQ